jgi:hypothetical protein
MTPLTKLGAYAVGVAVAFGAATGVGAAVGPVGTAADGEHGQHGEGDVVPGGLAVSRAGYTLVPGQDTLPAGQPTTFRFTITGIDGTPVTRYEREHDKDLHLILVRRDLSGFQHLHPTLGAGGVWSQRLTLPRAGDYRAFADFVPAGGPALTLGVDVHVAGDYQPKPLPGPARTATADGYTVTLAGDCRPARPHR